MNNPRSSCVVEGELLYEKEYFQVVSSSISDLHRDIIYNIFARLQVKFICRCKLVCRAWYNLISVPDFIRYYAKNTPFTTLVFSRYNKSSSVDPRRNTFSFFEIKDNNNISDWTLTTFEPKLPAAFLPSPSVTIMGSCNGLLCLRLGNNNFEEVIYIYNPNSGESVSLPKHTFEPYELSYVVVLGYLFCFSPSSNNFKVVKIVSLRGDEAGRRSHVQRCEIFTVGVDHEWRRLEHPFKPGHPCRTLEFNGVVCWLPCNNNGSTNIACFDFGEEKVVHVSCPSNVVRNYRNMNLVVLNHRLCLVDHSNPCHFTIWTMEEYGIDESWTKSHVILTNCFPALARHLPIAKLRNGNLLFPYAGGKNLVCYSPRQKECTIVEISGDVEWCITYAQEFPLLGVAYIDTCTA